MYMLDICTAYKNMDTHWVNTITQKGVKKKK